MTSDSRSIANVKTCGKRSFVKFTAVGLTLISSIAFSASAFCDDSQLPAPTHSQGLKICNQVVGAIAKSGVPQDEHPFEQLLKTLHMALANYSFLAIGTHIDDSYQGLSSLAHPRRIAQAHSSTEPNEILRRAKALEFFDLLAKASTPGDDRFIAGFFFAMDKAISSLERSLFFSLDHTLQTFNEDAFRDWLMRPNTEFDTHLSLMSEMWQKISESDRAKILEWIGSVFADAVKTYYTTSIRFNIGTSEPPKIRSYRNLPDFQESLQDYLQKHAGGDIQQLTRDYYMNIGRRLISLFGVRDEKVSLPFETPAIQIEEAKETKLLGQ